MNNYNLNVNRQSNFQETSGVRSTRQVISNVHTLVGGILFGVGVFVFALHFLFDNSAAVLSLQITGGALALSGVIELVIAGFFRRSARREHEKLDRLKSEGRGFPAEIIKIHRHMGVRFGRSVSAYAECSYTNNDGKICLVSSNSFLYRHEGFSPWRSNEEVSNAPHYSGYSAKVYVHPRDPMDYSVEIFVQTPEVQADFDYRF